MKVTLVSPLNGLVTEQVDTDGFNGNAVVLGCLWYWYKGMWGEGLLYFVIALVFSFTVVVPIIVWIVMGARFNREYYQHLLKKGYKLKE